MGRIVHIALKCDDRKSFEASETFYDHVFGIYPTKIGHARGHFSRHLTDGNIDLALMLYDSEGEREANLAGAGPRIHHIGIEVTDRPDMVRKIEENGGTIFSDPEEGALKYRSPDGTLGEIVAPGRYPHNKKSLKSRISGVGMRVSDLDIAARFYENVFGFRPLGASPENGTDRHLTDGDTVLTLTAKGGAAGQGPGIEYWSVEVPDVAALAEAARAEGGTVLPRTVPLEIRGPDGNVVHVTPAGASPPG